MFICLFFLNITQSLLYLLYSGVSFDLFRLSNYVEFMIPPLTNGLSDSSAYVRKIAVLSCVKLFHIAPEHVAGMQKEKI